MNTNETSQSLKRSGSWSLLFFFLIISFLSKSIAQDSLMEVDRYLFDFRKQVETEDSGIIQVRVSRQPKKGDPLVAKSILIARYSCGQDKHLRNVIYRENISSISGKAEWSEPTNIGDHISIKEGNEIDKFIIHNLRFGRNIPSVSWIASAYACNPDKVNGIQMSRWIDDATTSDPVRLKCFVNYIDGVRFDFDLTFDEDSGWVRFGRSWISESEVSNGNVNATVGESKVTVDRHTGRVVFYTKEIEQSAAGDCRKVARQKAF